MLIRGFFSSGINNVAKQHNDNNAKLYLSRVNRKYRQFSKCFKCSHDNLFVAKNRQGHNHDSVDVTILHLRQRRYRSKLRVESVSERTLGMATRRGVYTKGVTPRFNRFEWPEERCNPVGVNPISIRKTQGRSQSDQPWASICNAVGVKTKSMKLSRLVCPCLTRPSQLRHNVVIACWHGRLAGMIQLQFPSFRHALHRSTVEPERENMKNLLCLTFVITTAIGLLTTVSHADDYELEVISELPLGKLAFVTGGSFGSTGTIVVVGQEAKGFTGGCPEFIDGGKKVIYSNRRGRTSALFVRNLSDNSIEEIETGMPDLDLDSPSLSPSGKKLAFVAWPTGRKSSHIHVADADGSHSQQLTFGDHHNWSPRWSPDGTKIVFESTRDDERQIYVMDTDGQNQTNLSNDKKMSHAPSWSPDGSHIAYMSGSGNKTCSIYVMKSDGTEKQNISHSLTRDSEPAWSPDSKWIAFTRTDSKPPGPETMDIWIMRRDGLEQRQITRNAVRMSSYQPTWSR